MREWDCYSLLSWINIMKMYLQKDRIATPHIPVRAPHSGRKPR